MVSYSYSHSSLYKRKRTFKYTGKYTRKHTREYTRKHTRNILKYPKATNKNKKFVITNNRYLLFGMITYK